jgi:hypothetical protein
MAKHMKGIERMGGGWKSFEVYARKSLDCCAEIL